ncbi:FAD/NAD(P)-binding protein [Brevibacterium ammoniilyticum]|uniref:FAD/NAD(P)-binding protein n=1 Tax=Brevibacterium ammoniilyticum TaxID=1046555 RepID=A0ABP9U3D3_9MICO
MSADHSVAIIGVGPRGLSVLERLVALASARWSPARGPITVHLIDPYPPGAGIVWRTDQPTSLLMNTTIGEQTIFPDASCSFLGEVPDESGESSGGTGATSSRSDSPAEATDSPAEATDRERGTSGDRSAESGGDDRSPFGPSMAEWYRARGGTEPVDSTFPSRTLYGEYLRDAYAGIRDAAPDFLDIVEHRTRAESVIDLPAVDLPGEPAEAVPPQLVRCEDGTTIIAAAVVLAVGHIPSAPTEERARLAAYAQRSGGIYIPQSLPAEAPLTEVPPHARVIIRGMGLNYFDVQTLLTIERGGRFDAVGSTDAGAVRYTASGTEPVLFLGSRRGIPYRSKPISDSHPRSSWPLRYFTKDNVALLAGLDDLDGDRLAAARFNDQLWPLILADLRFAYYRTLARTTPEAFSDDPGRLREAIAEAVSRHLTRRTWQETHPDAESASESSRQGRVTREAFAWAEIEEELVPDPAHRMSLHDLLDPLDGLEFPSREPGAPGSLHDWMLGFLRTDLRDSLAGPEASPVKALFMVLWQARLLLKELIAAGHIDPVSVDMEIRGWFENFVSGICDGPPPRRIAELIALAEAGIVRFIGPDMHIGENPAAQPAAAVGNADGSVADGLAAAVPGAESASSVPDAEGTEDPLPQIFAVTSARVAGTITGSVVIDAASPTNSLALAADVLIHGMVDRGQLTPARLTLDDGREKRLSGLAVTARPFRTIDEEGAEHPRRFALSIQLSAVQWGLAIAANPESDAATLADSHAAAEAILDLI